MDGRVYNHRKGNVMSKVWTVPPEKTMVEGESKAFVLTFLGATTISANPTNKIYLDEADLSSTNLTGTATRSGKAVTTQIVGSVKGGQEYILATTAVVDGNTLVRLTKITVLFPWGAS